MLADCKVNPISIPSVILFYSIFELYKLRITHVTGELTRSTSHANYVRHAPGALAGAGESKTNHELDH